jgi:2-polyprenyl-3-methyl-5-hydroxy-6-metoxy-1,4-benzoquinol methylase
MSNISHTNRKVLVAIASYGIKNDQYLARLIEEYRSMSFAVDIVVLSNVEKQLGPGVEVVVGLPSKDPWSLPFGHKRIFAERIDQYDLFIYSEDDTLLTQRNLEAFVQFSEVLPENEVAGFLRYEKSENGAISYPDVHGSYHWDPQSVGSRGAYRFAFFTNEHAACYVLTQRQLRRAIESGGFLVEPHQSEYDLLCAAGTDPYTQCGMRKLICISQFTDSLVHHLPNKYVGALGLNAEQFDHQIQALLKIAERSEKPSPLFKIRSHFRDWQLRKDYYEPVRSEFVDLIPAKAKSVLSVGCGWGATEESLARSGKRVVCVVLDPVISACAEARGLELIHGDLKSAAAQLSGRKFDCLYLSNVLHLMEDPAQVLASFSALLSERATVIAAVPNCQKLSLQWKKMRRVPTYESLGDFAKSGVHFASRNSLRQWLQSAGLKVDRFVDVLPKRAQRLSRSTLGLLSPFLSSEVVAVGAKS